MTGPPRRPPWALPAALAALAVVGWGGPAAAPPPDPFAGFPPGDVRYATAWVDPETTAGVAPDADGHLGNPSRLPALDLTVANLTAGPVRVRDPPPPGPPWRPTLMFTVFLHKPPPAAGPGGTLVDVGGVPEIREYGPDDAAMPAELAPPPTEDPPIGFDGVVAELMTGAGAAAADAAADRAVAGTETWVTVPPGGRRTWRVPLGELCDVGLSGAPRTISFSVNPPVRDAAGESVFTLRADDGAIVFTFLDPRTVAEPGSRPDARPGR